MVAQRDTKFIHVRARVLKILLLWLVDGLSMSICSSTSLSMVDEWWWLLDELWESCVCLLHGSLGTLYIGLPRVTDVEPLPIVASGS
jgi:hypothetical protein